MTSATETSNEAWPVAKNKMVTAIVASLLGWSLDLFDLFILLYVAPDRRQAVLPVGHPDLVARGGLRLVRRDAADAAGRIGVVRLLWRPLRPPRRDDRRRRRRRHRDSAVRRFADHRIRSASRRRSSSSSCGSIQGIFVGGVVASTHTIGTESVPPYWRGAMSGLIGGGGAGIGALVASVAYLHRDRGVPRRSVCRLGLALHVLLRDHQLGARLLHLQQARGIAGLGRAPGQARQGAARRRCAPCSPANICRSCWSIS